MWGAASTHPTSIYMGFEGHCPQRSSSVARTACAGENTHAAACQIILVGCKEGSAKPNLPYTPLRGYGRCFSAHAAIVLVWWFFFGVAAKEPPHQCVPGERSPPVSSLCKRYTPFREIVCHTPTPKGCAGSAFPHVPHRMISAEGSSPRGYVS
jgi:hypothetical protein